MNKRFRSKRAKLGLAMLAAFCCLLTAEVGLRIAGIGFPRPYIPDKYIGTRFQPGFESWFGKEGGAYVAANQMGFRDIDHEAAKPKGEFRIAVLGDSYVEAAQVPLEATFWKQLEATLNSAKSEQRTKVMGFGMSGFGTAQALLMFRHYVKPLQPDVVVLAMTLTNDVRNNSMKLEPVKERPFFVLDDERLVLDDSFLQHPVVVNAQQPGTQLKTELVNSSKLLQLLSEFKNSAPAAAATDNAELGLDGMIYRPPESEQWREAWSITEKLVLQLNAEVTAAGAKLVVMSVTDGMQVHPKLEVYNQFCQQLGVADLGYAERRMSEFCEQNSIRMLALGEPLRRTAVSENLFLHGFANTKLGTGHWNETGHRLAAQLLSQFIKQQTLQSSDAPGD